MQYDLAQKTFFFICFALKTTDLCYTHVAFLWLASGGRLGVKIQNLKVDFKTGGTWRRVGQ